MKRGFTLLEVLVAVTILALGLSALFTSQIGAIRIAQRSRTTTIATLLARCKMAEVEEELAREGLPASDSDGTDECCVDAEHEGYTCDWEVKRIVLPDDVALDEEEGLPTEEEPPQLPEGEDGSEGDPLGGLLGDNGGAAAAGLMMGDTSSLAGMVLPMVFPIIKGPIEDQIRRVTVTVNWTEGDKQLSFDVVQFVASDNFQLPEDQQDPDGEDALLGRGGAGGQGARN